MIKKDFFKCIHANEKGEYKLTLFILSIISQLITKFEKMLLQNNQKNSEYLQTLLACPLRNTRDYLHTTY